MDTVKVNPKPEAGMCACGLPLHYTDPEKQKRCEELVAMLGEFIKVTDSKHRTFWVQRHYIALHGIKEVDLAELGFLEVRQFA